MAERSGGASALSPSPAARGKAPILRTAVGLAISVGCLALVLRAVSLDAVASSLRAGNALVLVPATALYFVGVLVRSLRWRVLLRGQPVHFPLLFRTLVIGLMVNDLLPG